MRPALLVPPADAANGQRHEMAPLQKRGQLSPRDLIATPFRGRLRARLRPGAETPRRCASAQKFQRQPESRVSSGPAVARWPGW